MREVDSKQRVETCFADLNSRGQLFSTTDVKMGIIIFVI